MWQTTEASHPLGALPESGDAGAMLITFALGRTWWPALERALADLERRHPGSSLEQRLEMIFLNGLIARAGALNNVQEAG